MNLYPEVGKKIHFFIHGYFRQFTDSCCPFTFVVHSTMPSSVNIVSILLLILFSLNRSSETGEYKAVNEMKSRLAAVESASNNRSESNSPMLFGFQNTQDR